MSQQQRVTAAGWSQEPPPAASTPQCPLGLWGDTGQVTSSPPAGTTQGEQGSWQPPQQGPCPPGTRTGAGAAESIPGRAAQGERGDFPHIPPGTSTRNSGRCRCLPPCIARELLPTLPRTRGGTEPPPCPIYRHCHSPPPAGNHQPYSPRASPEQGADLSRPTLPPRAAPAPAPQALSRLRILSSGGSQKPRLPAALPRLPGPGAAGRPPAMRSLAGSGRHLEAAAAQIIHSAKPGEGGEFCRVTGGDSPASPNRCWSPGHPQPCSASEGRIPPLAAPTAPARPRLGGHRLPEPPPG